MEAKMGSRRASIALTFFLSASVLGFLVSLQAQTSEDEQTLWKFERAYWNYVQDNDLPGYRSLWNEAFVGWPAVSAAPVHKNHITDWITAQTSKGLAFKTVEFKPAAIRVSGDVAMTFYWITFKWVDKNGEGRHLARSLHDRGGQGVLGTVDDFGDDIHRIVVGLHDGLGQPGAELQGQPFLRSVFRRQSHLGNNLAEFLDCHHAFFFRGVSQDDGNC